MTVNVFMTVKEMKDSQGEIILAAIIAGAESSGRRISRGYWGCFTDDRSFTSCCAVGAGCLFAGIQACIGENPLAKFARHYGVSELYALGVSMGFEESAEDVDFSSDFPIDLQRLDYQRGFAVGAAAYDALVDEYLDDSEAVL